AFQPDGFVPVPGGGHDFEVRGGIGRANRLDVELVELAIAPGLRPVVAKDGADRVDFDRLRPGVHAVLDVGPDGAGGEFGTQREHVVAAVLERINFLVDDICAFANAAREKRYILEVG